MALAHARVHPRTVKSLSEICTNFVVDVCKQLMAHRNKQIELQKEHEAQIASMLEKSDGVWLSNRWLTIIFIVYNVCFLIALTWGFLI